MEYSFGRVGPVSPQSVPSGLRRCDIELARLRCCLLGLALTLLACLVGERRLLAGLHFLVTLAAPITAVPSVGLAIDGTGPFIPGSIAVVQA